ncbi:WD40 repeat domain-containing protein [Marinobacter sp. M3C]|uniref:WD40 repeat domain-containing protein n=1 Tax=Marinobacter sp. M3C TaxID=2917715 RepID=UPI00200F740E|nr:WD40 repeat domain-containing protein [Marinobacter sp. M3C]UQG59529.1 WD40 repeat domain-containing protein [Marinobacter sp. M3C]
MAVINANKVRWIGAVLGAFVLISILLNSNLLGVWAGPVMSMGVSESGRYVVSAHTDNKLILWDLQEKQWNTLSGKANLYSAYFVPGQNAFLWQDTDNTVTAQTVDGKVLKRFQHFPSYGHVISADLETYLSADEHWNVFSGYGDTKRTVLSDGISPSFLGSGKLFNLAIDRNNTFFVTAGVDSDRSAIADHSPLNSSQRFSKYGGVTLWNAVTKQPVAKLRGNSSKTHATISPDGQWVVSADEAGIGLFWNTDKPEVRHRLARYHSGIYLDDRPFEVGDPRNRDKSGLIDTPAGLNDFTIAVAFIHNSKYYLRFGNNSHVAALFKTGSPWPVKYFDLGKSPKLVTYGSQYDRNTAIATSPESGTLVMGHQSTGGISVYQFDPEELTLERVWVVE